MTKQKAIQETAALLRLLHCDDMRVYGEIKAAEAARDPQPIRKHLARFIDYLNELKAALGQ